MGPSYEVMLYEGVLTYSGIDGSYQTKAILIPTQEQWGEFRNTLDVLNIWDWCKSYIDRNCNDGTQWSLDIAYGDRKLRANGSNSYPETFKGYLAAIEKLLGGRTFR